MAISVLALRLARRDLRGALGSFWILVLGIALGVAAVAAVGSVAGAVLDGVRAGARLSVGGDVSLRLFHHPATPEQVAFLSAAGRHSETAELRPLAHRADGGAASLVELKAVDETYPLYGAVALEPAMPLSAALERRGQRWGAAVDQALLDALGLDIGDPLRLGALTVEIRARVAAEPDRALRAFSLGPRVMIARPALEASGLAPPGAQVYWYSRVRLDPGRDAAAWIAEVERRFPDAGWRIVNAADGVPGIERTVQIGRVLLVLAGLSVLLIGGVGVGSAIAAHLGRKTATIAVLKSLGASGRLIFAIYLAEVMAAAAIASVLGLAAGAAAPYLAAPLAGDWLPIAPGLQPRALAAAAGFGLLTALLFALWPLARAQALTPQELFRDVVAHRATRPGRRALAAIGATAAALLALLLASTDMPVLAAGFALAALVAVLLFLGLGRAVAWAAGRARTRRPLLRLALGNLSRPGAATGPVVMALGLSLTLLVAVETIAENAGRHVAAALPEQAPDLVFINVPPARGADFAATVAAVPGVDRIQRMPFLHARLTAIDGEPTHRRRVPADIAWVARGDRGLSWAAEPPPGGEIVAGAWWPADHAGPPLASLDAKVADRLGVGVGDTLTLNILGRPRTVEIANLRRIDWTNLGLDFPILLSPPAEPPPHTEVAAVWAAPGAIAPVVAAAREAFPETPPIRVAPVLAALSEMLAGATQALSLTSGVTVAAALLVLAGSVAAGYRRRVREMVLLKVVGARPRQLVAACALEFALLGAAAASLACLLGTAIAWAVVSRIMAEGWSPAAAPAAVLAAAAVATMTATGLVLSRRALSHSPGAVLRQRNPAG